MRSSPSPRPVGLTQFNICSRASPWDASMPPACSPRGAVGVEGVARSPSAENDGLRIGRAYLLAREPLPDAAFYEDFPQIENGVGPVASLRVQLERKGSKRFPDSGAAHASSLERRDGTPHGRPGAADRAADGRAHGSHSSREFAVRVPAWTTAGLLVGADMRRALAGRTDWIWY